MSDGRRGGRRLRLAAACAATAALLGPVIWFWQDSRLASTYSVMDMGYADQGHPAGDPTAHSGHDMAGHGTHATGTRSVTSLTADRDRPADVTVTLTARQASIRLASGRTIDGYTLNDPVTRPVITAKVGQLVQVRLVNESVPGGITLHWHGLDVPNADDGVAGVTQDAVGTGQEFTYRFVVDQVGTFWYHSHQLSDEQVRKGLLGALVVTPASPPADVVDVVALMHLYGGTATINGRDSETRVEARPGQRTRVRVINTENGQVSVRVAGAPFRLLAIDGTDLNAPTPVSDMAVPVTAGGRADLEVTMPQDGSPVRVSVSGSAAVVLGSTSYDAPPVARTTQTLDPLGYGASAPLGFDPDKADRRFRYDIGRRPGFLDGRPGLFWTVNGHLYPDVPMFVVADGDVVRMRISNNSGEVHPMHLHGHHAVVLSRNGVPATGSPWWVDSLNVGNGETYEIAFLADNPGIWMDHCHNLPHASQGLVAHLMYEGVTTPFKVGGDTGNTPE